MIRYLLIVVCGFLAPVMARAENPFLNAGEYHLAPLQAPDKAPAQVQAPAKVQLQAPLQAPLQKSAVQKSVFQSQVQKSLLVAAERKRRFLFPGRERRLERREDRVQNAQIGFGLGLVGCGRSGCG